MIYTVTYNNNKVTNNTLLKEKKFNIFYNFAKLSGYNCINNSNKGENIDNWFL